MERATLVEFRNKRDPKGYHLKKRGKSGLWITRSGGVKEELSDCLPLTGKEYLQFAALTDPQGLLNFVRCYGPLGNWVVETLGDPVENYLAEARDMQEVLKAVKESPMYLPDRLLERLTRNAMAVERVLVWNAATRTAVWQHRAPTLFAALWAQAIDAVTRGVQFHACEYCGIWFETGTRAGRRSDARFCSDAHRMAFKNRARSKKQEGVSNA